ncbi:MAG: hypothetical protein PHN45_07005 [Methylococcales bacterium]|nr:hypothetical protein [Methylococcales bacterium]MDD5754486.1 hypothetical protein [Methylococcales bacterium]
MTSQQRKNRQLIIGIFAMSIIPFSIAWFLAKNPELLTPSATNHGQLITPIITTERTDFKGFDTFSQDNLKELDAHWLIVNVIPKIDCGETCLDAIHKSRQLRLMLNKELVRTRRAVLVLDSNVSQDTASNWWKEDGDLLRLKPNVAVIEKLNLLYNGQIPEGALLLVDPLGNFMMQYAPNFNPYDAKSDLMHLLKISQIG